MSVVKAFSQRYHQLSPSPILALDVQVKKLQAQGIPVINLCLGEPDFDTPENIKQAAIDAINGGFTHYTPVSGILELRQAIANKFNTENNLVYQPDEIAVGVGSRQLAYHALQILCQPGDEVIIATPTWTSFIEHIKLAGAMPVTIELSPPFKLTAQEVATRITPRTTALLLVNPNNPTGAIIEVEELTQIAELAIKHDLWVLADEIYEKLIYEKQHTSIASLSPEIKERTLTINAFSKAYAMTGWRLGYAGGPKALITAIIALQGQTTSNAPSMAQKAGIAALTGDQSAVALMKAEFKRRRDFIFEAVQNIPGLSLQKPEGAFYAFISLHSILGKKYQTSLEWCSALLAEENIAVVPGEAFLAPEYMRLSYAASMEELERAMAGIKKFVEST